MMLCVSGQVDPPLKFTAIEAGNSSGKTRAAAVLVLWFLSVHEPEEKQGVFVCTFATKKDQLMIGLWKEIERMFPLFQKLHPNAQLFMSLQNLSIKFKGENKMAVGYSAMKKAGSELAVDTSGMHDKDMLFIFEETPGVYPPVVEAIRRTCSADNNRILFIGNPTGEHDLLHEQCMSTNTHHLRISGLDHVNVVTGKALIPGAITREFVADRLEEAHGIESHVKYLVPVRGVCPTASDKSIITQELLDLTSPYLRPKSQCHSYRELKKTHSRGKAIIYDAPRTDKIHRYIAFIDPAGDQTEIDWHCMVMYDRESERIAGLVHMIGDQNDFVEEALNMCYYFGVPWNERNTVYYPLLAWERNIGSIGLHQGVRDYKNKYKRRSLDGDKSKRSKLFGWHTGKQSRIVMQNCLMEWILTLYEEPDRLNSAQLWSELATFIRTKTHTDGSVRYEHASGRHDDVVMSFAGCLAIDQELLSKPPREIITTPQQEPEQGNAYAAQLLSNNQPQRSPWSTKPKPWGTVTSW